MGAPPWDDPERYLRNSPLMHVKDIETPIMLLSGDRDYVPTQQAEEFFTALTRLGKDAVLVRYFGEDHVYHSRSEEHTSELQSLMRISYAVFCLKKKKRNTIYLP